MVDNLTYLLGSFRYAATYLRERIQAYVHGYRCTQIPFLCTGIELTSPRLRWAPAVKALGEDILAIAHCPRHAKAVHKQSADLLALLDPDSFFKVCECEVFRDA
jgi:hypothetical protein